MIIVLGKTFFTDVISDGFNKGGYNSEFQLLNNGTVQ